MFEAITPFEAVVAFLAGFGLFHVYNAFFNFRSNR